MEGRNSISITVEWKFLTEYKAVTLVKNLKIINVKPRSVTKKQIYTPRGVSHTGITNNYTKTEFYKQLATEMIDSSFDQVKYHILKGIKTLKSFRIDYAAAI